MISVKNCNHNTKVIMVPMPSRYSIELMFTKVNSLCIRVTLLPVTS